MIEKFTTIAVTAGFHGIISSSLYSKKIFFLFEDLPRDKHDNNEPIHHWICSDFRDRVNFEYSSKHFLQMCGSFAKGPINHDKNCKFCSKYADIPDADYKALYKRNQYLNVVTHIFLYGVVCIYIPFALVSYYKNAQKAYMEYSDL